jgi:4-hydroxymandelate oxidase
MTVAIPGVACVDDLRPLAEAVLAGPIRDYIAGGAGAEHTLLANRTAFTRTSLLPRVLVDVSRRNLRTTLLGTEVVAPLGIAPMSYHCMAHVDGELATVRAAGAEGLVTTVATFASRSLEETARTATGPLWFQLYVLRDRAVTLELIGRAEAAGCRALVLTVDAPVFGYRDRDVRNGFRLPEDVSPANLRRTSGAEPTRSLAELNQVLVDPSLSWRDIEWLCGTTRLPIVVKGVLAPDDAARAVQHGVAAVWVSNHGGRQVDGAIATLTALPAVLEAVAGRCEVYLDGGVRRGTDVLKALALGARAVFVGRPVLWGLAVDGERGVRAALRMYLEELELTMAACGCPDVAGLGPHLVRGRE